MQLWWHQGIDIHQSQSNSTKSRYPYTNPMIVELIELDAEVFVIDDISEIILR